MSAVGLGGALWSLPEPLPHEDSLQIVHAALDAGITLLDTARAYTTVGHPSHNEWLITEALHRHPRGTDAFVATKGGHFRTGESDFLIDGTPEALRRDCELSLSTLRVDRIGLYQLHYPDPDVDLEESVGALADLRDEGKIALIGLSNVKLEQIEKARSVTPIASVQNHFSPEDVDDRDTVLYCDAAGIAYLSYSPFGGVAQSGRLVDRLPIFADTACQRGLSVQQVVLAWLLRQSSSLIPLVGCRRTESIVASAEAIHVVLDADELERLDASLAPAPSP